MPEKKDRNGIIYSFVRIGTICSFIYLQGQFLLNPQSTVPDTICPPITNPLTDLLRMFENRPARPNLPPIAIKTEAKERYQDRSTHPDFNIVVRGYEKDGLVPKLTVRPQTEEYVDPHVPDITTLLDHPVVIKEIYRVRDWDWTQNQPGQLLAAGTLVGIQTHMNEPIFAPSIGYDIGGRYKYMVIFANEDQIAINSTRDGNAARGYTIHIKGIKVDDLLLNYFQRLSNQGGSQLPAIGPLTLLGCASSITTLLAIRDTGTFMPANDQKDWGFDQTKLSPQNRP